MVPLVGSTTAVSISSSSSGVKGSPEMRNRGTFISCIMHIFIQQNATFASSGHDTIIDTGLELIALQLVLGDTDNADIINSFNH